MARKVGHEKLDTLSKLSMGDKIELRDGSEYEFIRLKRTRFIGRSLEDDVSYDIHVNSFNEVLERTEDNTEEEIRSLNPGELIYINDKGSPVLLRYKRMKGEKLICSNVISGGRVKVDPELYVGKVKDLKEEDD